jgi:membrane-bound lytic murein transglycosylase D
MVKFFDKTRRTSMAPVSRTWRHQLGEATTNQWRTCHRATLPFLFLTLFLTTQAESNTVLDGDIWNDHSVGFVSDKGPQRLGTLQMANISSTPALSHASPAGGSINRMKLPIPNHPAINKYIQRYNNGERKTFLEALDRSWLVVPVMEEIFRSEGVPEDLVYIALIESCFKGKASYRGAGGYWQLMSPTARSFGLRVDRWVDERVDPVKSSHAAARYLQMLYREFESWPLAMAAYNVGNAPIARATRRHDSDDFWVLYDRNALPGRTREYVPKVLAAIQIVRNLEAHGFNRPGHHPVFDFESIQVSSPLKLREVAGWLEVPVCELRNLNPSLRQDCIPPGSEFTLRLPLGAHDRFEVAYKDYDRK